MTGGQMSLVNAEFFGKDPRIQKSVNVAKNIAVTKAPVLIVGEVGVGKKTLAKFIHQSSTRAGAPVVVVDCSNDAKQVENEILGHRDEATGRFIKGALETANGGAVILSNIDGMDEQFQKRIHKVLNELEDYDLDIRIIATTTKNLSKLVGSGRFYRGLYTHVSGNAINLTPLRERTSDLEYLARFFANQFNKTNTPSEIAPGAMTKILSHYWTHNVHELRTVIESSMANSQNGILTEADLEIGEKQAVSMIADEDNEGIKLMSLKEAEKLLIKKALIHTSENRTQAAKILGVSIRTLRNKINEYRGNGNAYFVNLR